MKLYEPVSVVLGILFLASMISSEFKTSILMVTHNVNIANRFDKTYILHNGAFE